MFSSVMLLCLIFNIYGAHEVNPGTLIGITDPGLTYVEALWILKDWRSFTTKTADIYSPTFTSITKQSSKFRFRLRWLINDGSEYRSRSDNVLKILFYNADSSDLSQVTLRVKMTFLNLYQ
uniref:Uncharacterized protein n=1 Tax=Strigamia maritima TaxID=126957 RepID=T1JPH3_STRMM